MAFAASVPLVLSAVVGGPLIDLLGYARTSVLSDLACAVVTGAFPLLYSTVGLSFWQLIVLVAAAGLFHAPGDTARFVLVPLLAERAGTPLTRATSAYEGASRGATMLGAPLAGVVIAVAGAANSLLVDASSFAVSAVLVAAGVSRAVPRARPAERMTFRGYRAELGEGYRYLRGTTVLLTIVVMVMVTNALDQAWSSVLLPVDARAHLGGTVQLGLVSGTFGGAALVGSLLFGWWAGVCHATWSTSARS